MTELAQWALACMYFIGLAAVCTLAAFVADYYAPERPSDD